MRKILKTVYFFVLFSLCSPSIWAASNQTNLVERNDFYFLISNYETKRQGGQKLNIYVKFAYKKDLPTSEYVDYRLMRKDVLAFMEPSAELPVNIYWEIIATKMGRDLIKKYPLEGVSVQLQVLNNLNPDTYEPGEHGPIFTIGSIEPIQTLH
jgi:hypothetical protein